MISRFRLLFGALLVTLMLVGCADASADEAGSSVDAVTDPTAARDAVLALENAIEKKDEVDARLSRALGRVGGMLTTEQQRDFVKGFNLQPDVAATLGDYHTRATALAAALDAIAADPMGIDQYGPRRLFDGYVLLAKTPSALSSLSFATKVLTGRIVLRGIGNDQIAEKVLGPSLAPAFLRNLLDKGNVEDAIRGTELVLDKTQDLCLKVAGWLQRYKALDGADLLAENIGIDIPTAVQGLRTIAGLIAIWEIGSDLVAGDVNAALQQFLDSGPNAVNGLAEATSLFRRIVLGIEKTPLADNVIRWSGKVAQGIGLVMNAIKLWNDAGKWNDSLDAKVRVIGDIVALGASILVLAGAGPIGPILGAVALGISFFADWLENRRLAELERNDLAASLPVAGIDAALTETMIKSHPTLIRALVKDVHLAPEHIQWLLRTDPMSVREDSYTNLRFIGVQVAQVIFALDGTETYEMLRAAVGTETDARKAEYKLDMFMRGLEHGTGFRGDLSKAEALDWIAAEANSPYIRDGEEKAVRASAFIAASAYLATR